MLSYPGRIPATRIAAPVSLRDLAATTLDLAGISAGGEIGGTSLAPFWSAGASRTADESVIRAEIRKGVRIPRRYPAADANLHTLLARGYQYIVNGDGSEELYHNAVDPEQRHNLVEAVEATGILTWFRERMQDR
jgi:arylsulfatase A-like enzyme